MIRELETRVQQLSVEAETLSRVRGQLEHDRCELETKVERQQGELHDFQLRLVNTPCTVHEEQLTLVVLLTGHEYLARVT